MALARLVRFAGAPVIGAVALAVAILPERSADSAAVPSGRDFLTQKRFFPSTVG